MPHFVIDCSATILTKHDQHDINQQVHNAAVSSDLFIESDIKVRVNSYTTYLVGNKKTDFIHVFASIMEGRTNAQKAELSRKVVNTLTCMFPEVNNIAMSVTEFEKATYCNKAMLLR